MKKINTVLVAIVVMVSITLSASAYSVGVCQSGWCITTTETVTLTATAYGYIHPMHQWQYKDDNGVWQPINGATFDQYLVYEPGTYRDRVHEASGGYWSHSDPICIVECTIVPLNNNVVFRGSVTRAGAVFVYNTSIASRLFLESSFDGNTFSQVSEVYGTTYTDSTFSGKRLYRLRVVALSGAHVEEITHSRVVVLEQKKETTICFYPNPTQDLLYVHGLNENTTIRLFAMNGQQVLVYHAIGNAALPMKQLPAGAYVCKIMTERGDLVSSSVIIKK